MLSRALLLSVLVSLTSACNLSGELLATVTARPQPIATPVSAWKTIEHGLEWRTLRPNGDELSQFVALRIDPQRFRFRAIYRESDPRSLAGWRELEPAASVIINANFFDQANRVLGAVVSDGVAYGNAYRERGGTFMVRSDEPAVMGYRSGLLQIDQTLEQAIQGFPLLVYQGAPAYFGSPAGERNRRTVIAEDAKGNILIMVAPFLGPSLADLSAYLPTTDLDIVTAINLDGGGSTMIAVPGADYFQPSLDAVPTILAAYPR